MCHFTKVNIKRRNLQEVSHQVLFPIPMVDELFNEMLAKNFAQMYLPISLYLSSSTWIVLIMIIYYYYIHGTHKLQKSIQELTGKTQRASSEGIPRPLPNSPFSPVQFIVNGIELSKISCVEDDYIQCAKSCFPIRLDLKAVHSDATATETSVQVCLYLFLLSHLLSAKIGMRVLLPLCEWTRDPTLIRRSC